MKSFSNRAGWALVIGVVVLVSPMRAMGQVFEPGPTTETWDEFFAFAACAFAAYSAVATGGATAPAAFLACGRAIVNHMSD